MYKLKSYASLLIALFFTSLFFTFSMFILSSPAHAGRPELSGEIEYEEEEAQGSPYRITQDKVMEFFKNLLVQMESLTNTGSAHIPEMDENALQFLTAAYLYCSLNQGRCPLILDALLEADLINAKLRHNNECPLLKRFWRLWLKNDMEKRQEYMVKTGFMHDTQTFKKSDRPRYIKCDVTISAETDSPLTNIEYFKKRYQEGSTPRSTIMNMPQFLEALKAKVTDVFAATETKLIMPPGKDDKGGKKKGKNDRGSGDTGQRKGAVKKSF